MEALNLKSYCITAPGTTNKVWKRFISMIETSLDQFWMGTGEKEEKLNKTVPFCRKCGNIHLYN